MRVTVAICTWNRARSLRRTLEAFVDLIVPADVTWELLIVNNNSTDDTDDVIAEYATRLPIVGVWESRSGKSHAANAAVANASGELMLWTDDDVVVDRAWLAEFVAAARQHPDAMYFGGTVGPLFDGTAPSWIQRNVDLLSEPYALADYGPETISADECNIVGANMAVRTEIARLFPFNTQLGPTGTRPLRGEDTDLIARLRSAGSRGLFVGSARVLHVISPQRLTSGYLWHWYSGLGAYTLARGHATDVARVMGVPRWAIRKYLPLAVKCACLSPLKNAQWLRSLREAGLMWGYITESRRQNLAAARGSLE